MQSLEQLARGAPGEPSVSSAVPRTSTPALLDPSGALTAAGLSILKTALPHDGETVTLMKTEKWYQGDVQISQFTATAMRDVRAVAKKAGPAVSLADAAEAIRQAFAGGDLGSDRSDIDRVQMVYILYGIRKAQRAQQELAPVLAAHGNFTDMPVEQAWRMLMDHAAWGDGTHEGLQFENEPGYIGGMLNGLRKVLENDRPGGALNTDMYCDFHDTATQGVYTAETFKEARINLRKLGELTHPKSTAGDATAPRFKLGFRDGETGEFGLLEGKNLTHAGLKEFFENQKLHPAGKRIQIKVCGMNDDHRSLHSISKWNKKDRTLLFIPRLSKEIHRTKVTVILEKYAVEVGKASSEEDKLQAIARCAQRLEQAHVFVDGNARTVGFLTVNKLLLEQGLKPAMIANPNRFDGFSAAELAQEIKNGQRTFAEHCTKGTT